MGHPPGIEWSHSSHFPARVGLNGQPLFQKHLKSFFRWLLSAEQSVVIALSNNRFLQSLRVIWQRSSIGRVAHFCAFCKSGAFSERYNSMSCFLS